MVRAILHLICGNCGNSDPAEFLAEYDKGDSLTPPTIYITCANCGTLHDLSDNANIEPIEQIDTAIGNNKIQANPLADNIIQESEEQSNDD